MKALSIRQPWAWAIIYGGKVIENRTWTPSEKVIKCGDRFAVHASKGCTKKEYQDAQDFAFNLGCYSVRFPPLSDLQRGGIIGTVEYMGSMECKTHFNPWYMGPKGILIRDPKPCEFIEYKGRLGFFDLPKNISKKLK